MITIRYFAAAREAAGVAAERVPAGSLAAVLAAAAARHGAALAAVLDRCSYLVDGTAAHDRGRPVPAGATLDVLPPFAGG
ncbi:putative molybdenum cofactor biosynthesis protein D2 (MoaD2) / thiamineS [Pilimelia terevasa]|uniref:Putative molybdenum cofactor biosynthesis protein D2 (MoaD2) / thiamineS n=1 Tax=Pilimelia terevasa TaxID=53372 RepID=A0A8J3BPN6_9ACTN|nr:MoaD/ThiS family protein [Pilimelia terevasa]GGK37763.1 putative molybdenum cofactor biosynthesis protein D2 (MoaD2) / thiamineS [Pilimelia terevasa]